MLEIDLDLAEFTVLTPFPHTKAYDDMRKQKRIISNNWDDFNAGKVVFTPKLMSPELLQELYYFAWERFYQDEPQQYKMFKLIKKVTEREMAMGTYRPRRRDLMRKAFADVI